MFGLFVSCQGGAVDKPDDLLSKSEMAEIIKDLALSDQAIMVNNQANLSQGTQYILNKHKVSAKAFVESYKYYLVKNKLEDILRDANKLLENEEPRLKDKNVATGDIPLN